MLPTCQKSQTKGRIITSTDRAVYRMSLCETNIHLFCLTHLPWLVGICISMLGSICLRSSQDTFQPALTMSQLRLGESVCTCHSDPWSSNTLLSKLKRRQLLRESSLRVTVFALCFMCVNTKSVHNNIGLKNLFSGSRAVVDEHEGGEDIGGQADDGDEVGGNPGGYSPHQPLPIALHQRLQQGAPCTAVPGETENRAVRTSAVSSATKNSSRWQTCWIADAWNIWMSSLLPVLLQPLKLVSGKGWWRQLDQPA